MANASPVLISTAVAAGILQRTTSTVNRWAEQGLLPTAAKGAGIRGPRMFRLADVEALRDKITPAPSTRSRVAS